MKKLNVLYIIPILLPALSSCGHTHTFSPTWTYNDDQHWHAATCGHNVANSIGYHTDSDGDNLCDVCGKTMSYIPPVDKVNKIAIYGSLKKISYTYDEPWDYTGLSVKATTEAGETRYLNNDEYTLTPSRPAPKNFITSLVVTATYKNDTSITSSKTFKNITVEDEVYDEESEIQKYYSDCNLTYTGTSLMNEIHRHSFAKHTYFVKYGETQAYLGKTKEYEAPDLIPGEHKIEHFYTGNKTDYFIGTREHVWACNDSSGLWPHGKVDDSSYYGGGSDLYHIRPSNSSVNTARGDAPFVDFDDSEFSSKKSSVVEVGDDGPYKIKIWGATEVSSGVYEYASLVEAPDEFKGDIARIIAYVYMHYNTNSKTPSSKKSLTASLDLTKAIGFSTLTKVKNTLKSWNELDPVSEVEKRRNHTVQQIQGNRNPFVDYPDLMNKLF